MNPIVLGTQSKYKIALFERLGLPFITASPPFEEFIDPAQSPKALASLLAEGKAASLAADYPAHIIIGADQVLALGEKVFSKPGDTERAVAQLLALSGERHYLHTAFCVLNTATGEKLQDVVSSGLRFRANLNPDYLRGMVEADQSWDCVGGYKMESRGILLIEEMETPDPNAIVGLPLIALTGALHRLGFFSNLIQHPDN